MKKLKNRSFGQIVGPADPMIFLSQLVSLIVVVDRFSHSGRFAIAEKGRPVGRSSTVCVCTPSLAISQGVNLKVAS